MSAAASAATTTTTITSLFVVLCQVELKLSIEAVSLQRNEGLIGGGQRAVDGANENVKGGDPRDKVVGPFRARVLLEDVRLDGAHKGVRQLFQLNEGVLSGEIFVQRCGRLLQLLLALKMCHQTGLDGRVE